MFANRPGEHQVPELVLCWFAFCYDLQVFALQFIRIPSLYEHATGDLFVLKSQWRFGVAHAQNTQVLFRFQNIKRGRIIISGNDYLSEYFNDGASRRLVNIAIESDDAAECRSGISSQRATISLFRR